MAEAIASCLGVVKTEVKDFFTTYKPSITLEKRRCIAGRATLQRLTSSADVVTAIKMWVHKTKSPSIKTFVLMYDIIVECRSRILLKRDQRVV